MGARSTQLPPLCARPSLSLLPPPQMGSRATPLHSFSTFLTGFLLLFAVPALGLLRYIDDSLGDLITGDLPTYRPEGNWKAGALCESCAVNPDPDTAFNGTWHESQSNSTESSREIEFTFNGDGHHIG
jgi:hypothetical protein